MLVLVLGVRLRVRLNIRLSGWFGVRLGVMS